MNKTKLIFRQTKLIKTGLLTIFSIPIFFTSINVFANEIPKHNGVVMDGQQTILDPTENTEETTEETTLESQQIEEKLLENQHKMEWAFYVFDEPKLTSTIIEKFQPQIINIIEKQEDGWAKIGTYKGEVWVYLPEQKYYLDQTYTLYDEKNGTPSNSVISPQIVSIILEEDNWLLINTWLGEKWVNLYSSPSSDPRIEYVSRKSYGAILPNEVNDIVIAMYHGIIPNLDNSDTVHRSVVGFKEDLELLYQNGYRLISMEDLMSNNITIEEGYTPLVLTFDDGLATSFSLTKDSNGNLSPTENCAVDIINKFNETNPDFGTHGMFYCVTTQNSFKGDSNYKDSVNYLLENGYEVGSHTNSHANLAKLSATGIQKEMALSSKYIYENTDGLVAKYVAYPYGEIPNNNLNKYLLNGTYNNYSYNFNSGVLASANTSTSTLTYSKKFNKYKLGRYRGTNNSVMDLNWKINNDSAKNLQFISDGNPDTITILEKDLSKINLNNIGNKKIILITNN